MLHLMRQNRLKTSLSTGDPVLLAMTFSTNGSNNVISLQTSAPASNPVVASGGGGTQVFTIGRFRALRAYARLAGPQATTGVTYDGDAGTITVTTALSQDFAFLFFVEMYSS